MTASACSSLVLEFMLAALFILQTGTNAQAITFPAELNTSVNLPCGCTICPESTIGVQWYLSSNQQLFQKDGNAVAWWSEGRNGSTDGFETNADYSMKIYSVTLEQNKQLFRCLVIPADGSADCTYDVKLDIYAKPEGPPAIDYVRHPDHTGGFNVTCSMSHVFPKTYPIFESKKHREGNETKRSLPNNDGTFNTIVTKYFSTAEGDTSIECHYSFRNFDSKSSLRVVDYGDIIGRDGEGDCMNNNATGSNLNCRCPRLWLLWTTLMMGIIS